jgi:hypothetical protein
MTRTAFEVLCGQHLIDPALALENDRIVKALRARVSIAELDLIMTAEF